MESQTPTTMKCFEFEQLVIDSLENRGANCKIEKGMLLEPNNIIVGWKSTEWRVMVKKINYSETMHHWPTVDEIRRLQKMATDNNQTAVVAWVYHDNNIEYRVVGQECVDIPKAKKLLSDL